MGTREQVGHQLVSARVISQADLSRALEIQQQQGGRLGSILVRLGVLSDSTLLEFLSQQYGVPTVELSTCSGDTTLQSLIPVDLMQQHLIYPVKRTASRLTLAMADPTNTSLLDELRFRTGLHVIPMVASESDVQAAIQQAFPKKGFDSGHSENTSVYPRGTHEESGERTHQMEMRVPTSIHSHSFNLDVEGDLTAVEVVNQVLQQAIAMEASDIHIEPLERMVRVRYRLDGVLQPITNLSRDLLQGLVARVKILSNLDIAERRLPQDGRMKLEKFPDVDLRVAILPCLYGEKVVFRLLNQAKLEFHITNLGLEPQDLDRVVQALENPYGMVLVTGPTGSGKTTTLYSALQSLNTPLWNIVTVEDPVEYQIQGINQLQIHEEIGLTFAAGLRAFLRQDPDVMMVGEIRDHDTAQIAIQASLTGHRVLSTLHTVNAPGAITRLIDMGIEPFLVSSALSLIIAQRLVRKLCPECRVPDHESRTRFIEWGITLKESVSGPPMRGRGCEYCHFTGFKGRMPLFEVLPLGETLHELILARASTSEIQACARKQGFRTLREAGLSAVQQGQTALSEVLVETKAD